MSESGEKIVVCVTEEAEAHTKAEDAFEIVSAALTELGLAKSPQTPSEEEAVVVLVENHNVVCLVRSNLVAPHLERPEGFIRNCVEEV